MTLDQIKNMLIETKKVLDDVQVLFPSDKLEEEKQQLLAKQSSPDFYSNLKEVEKVGKKLASLEQKINLIKQLKTDYLNIEFLVEACTDEDVGVIEDIEKELKSLKKKSESLQLEGLFSGKYDHLSAILSIQSGAGGTEACDWADMLFRMYQRYLSKKGFKFQILDITEGDGAGIKGVTIKIDEENAYGYLKCEKGVHRLVRISPFDSNARRHTSFASVEVMPQIENEAEIEIKPEDIRVDVFRSGGCGGQGVNTTDSAVRIKHIPTGIIVQCQNERSQIQNRENALCVLRSKLAELEEEKKQADIKNIQGSLKKIEWGSQIRSYVFCPYTMVKDHRTDWETSDVYGFMDGNIEDCIEDYLKKKNSG